MTLPASIRVNAQFPFPSQVSGSGPVTITKNNGIWTVGFTIANMAAVPGGTPASQLEVLVWNTVTQSFQQTLMSLLPIGFIFTGSVAPGSAGGQTSVLGTLSGGPVLANNGQGIIYNTVAGGAVFQGEGSFSDVILANKNGSAALFIPTGTTNASFPGAGIFNGTAAPASAAGQTSVLGTLAAFPTLTNTGQGLFYNSATYGAVLQGDGSFCDAALVNKAGGVALGLLTGTGTLEFFGPLLGSSAAAQLGFATGGGAGGAVTQATSRTTGVTLNNSTGAITLFAAAPVVGTPVSFTLTNSAIAATDVVNVAIKSATNTYRADVTATAAGSCQITVTSLVGTASDSPVINFVVLKGSAN